jgi:hypothetical protein
MIEGGMNDRGLSLIVYLLEGQNSELKVHEIERLVRESIHDY